jgi:hypothetical protein
MTTLLRRVIALAASASLAACAGFGQDAGGIDGASVVVNDLARTLDASRTSQLARADALRGERRRAEVVGRLATGGELDRAMFQRALCSGYESVGALRARSAELRAAQNGLTTLAGPSPDTIVGLASALRQGDSFPAPRDAAAIPSTPAPNLAALCAADADAAPRAIPATITDAGAESGALAILSAVDVFKSLVRPVIIAGMTRADRARRLRALRAWGNDTENGLPHLRELLRVARERAAIAAQGQRRDYAARAYIAWVALVAEENKARHPSAPANGGRTPAALRTCAAVDNMLETVCANEVQTRLQEKLQTFLNAATAYDNASDADPTSALRASEVAAAHLDAWLAGELTETDIVAVQAATFAALESWLQVFAAAERFWEDPAQKKRFSDAAEGLQHLFDED